MIIGVGVDSIEIARVADKCQRGSAYGFADKLFTELERSRAARSRFTPYQHLAACFAAREAFFKATQIWYYRSQVSVAQYPSGQPYYLLEPQLAEQLQALTGADGGEVRLHLSLTHDTTHATAFCVCEVVEQSR